MALGAVHPSLAVEYFFYAVIWSSGAAGDQSLIVDRFLLIVPLRNSLLLLISTLSLSSHCSLVRPPEGCLVAIKILIIFTPKLSLLIITLIIKAKQVNKPLRPPLPFEASLTEIFSIKELFEDFHSYTQGLQSDLHPNIELFIQSHKAKFFNRYSLFLQNCSQNGLLAREEINRSLEDSLRLITDKLESDLEPYRVAYLASPSYKAFQRSYFVYYN